MIITACLPKYRSLGTNGKISEGNRINRQDGQGRGERWSENLDMYLRRCSATQMQRVVGAHVHENHEREPRTQVYHDEEGR